ncbi:MAG: hypothetical protein EBX40_08505, partial [Gammaproteobacteria bacterium]|nr:hypothetical protein [Gammaproteobacteria bacterium]
LVDEHTHDIAASGFRLSKKPTDKLPIRASYRAALVELRDFFKDECGENFVRLYGYGSQFEETDSGEANEGAQESTDMDLSLFIKEEKGLEHFLKKLSDRGFIHAVGRQDYPMMSLKLARGEVTVEIHAVVVGAQAEETLDKMMQARINDALCKQKAQYYDCIKETLLRSDEDFSILHLRDDFKLNLSVEGKDKFGHADELALVLKLFFRNALRTRPLPVSIPMQRVVYDMMQHVDHPVVRLAFHLALKRYGLEYPEALKGMLSMFNVLGRMFDVTVKTSEKTDTQWIINVLKKFLKHVPEEQRERVTGTLKAWQEDIAQGIEAYTGREIRPQTVEHLNSKHYFQSTMPVSSPSPESSSSSEPRARSLQSPMRPVVSDASR